MAEVSEIEACGNPDHFVEIDSRQESNLYIPLTSRPQYYKAVDPKDSADSSDFSPLGTDSSTVQGIPKTILNQRSRKRRKQLHPSKSLSFPTDSTDASQCSSAASSPPHSMEERSTATQAAVLEEIEEDGGDASVEDSVTETPNSASPSKGADEEKSGTSKKKPKKSEVEILFSSMTTTDMAALYVRNRTEADGWYSPRKAPASTGASFAGSSITMTPTRTAAAVSKVINEVNLTSAPRSKAKQRISGPTVSLPRVTPATLRLRRPRSATAAEPSDAQKHAKQTAKANRPNVIAPQVRYEGLTAPGTSSLSSVDDDSMASSSRATGTRSSSSGHSQQLETVSTRHLPSAKSFKATFSFNETFCKYPPEIMLKDGELVPVHTMAVPLHAKVPQDHYLRRWKINRRRHADGNGSTTSAHPT